MLSACYEVITGRAPEMLRAYLLAVLIQMVVVNILVQYGHIKITIPPFFALGTVIGGFLYGFGMVLAMGCAGAVLYRVGEGKLDYVISLTGYSLGVWASDNWLVQPLKRILGDDGIMLTLHDALGVTLWLVIAIIILIGALWLIRAPLNPYHGGWNWAYTGFFVGLIGILAWLTSSITGQPSGLGTVQGSDSLVTFLLEGNPSALNWSFFVIVGIPLGSFIASQVYGKSPGKPFLSKRIPYALLGGVLMGMCAALAKGDNVLHGLSGVPLLALSSVLFMVSIFIGVWVGIRLGLLK